MVRTLWDLVLQVFSADGFVPRRICGRWPTWLIWEHVAGNAMVWVAYVAIPVVIGVMGSRKGVFDQFRPLVAAFAGFIFLCGLGHFLDMIAFLRPMYRFSGHTLIATGVASWGTVWALGRAWPAITSMRCPAELEIEVAARTEELAGANRALREGERRLRQLADAMPQVVWTAGADGVIDYRNGRWLELTGRADAGASMDPGEFGWEPDLHPDDRPGCLAAWRRSVGTGEPFQVELRFLDRASGEHRWHLARGVAARDADGRVTRWFGTCTDIDDRKRSEVERDRLLAQLDGERRHLRTLIESSHDAIQELDLDGSVVAVNATACQRLGNLPPEARWAEAWGDACREPARAALDRAVGGGVGSFEGFRPGDGDEPRWFDVTLTPVLDAAGRPHRILSVARDVTERRRYAEERERLLIEAQAANRAKDHFLAVLSHELRTPLNPILLAASSMLDRPVPPAEYRVTMEMIRENVAIQARLIDDLLDVMRIGRGEMPIHGEAVDCHAMIRQSLDSCRGEILGRSGRVCFEPGAALSWVEADAARLRQVFWNLIKNAVKFSPEGGAITIATRNAPAAPDAADPAPNLVIEVTDAGVGIDPAALRRIFEPFEQVDSTPIRRFGGLGLGLAICRGVVEAHGGTIVAESGGPGRGTTFRVALRTSPRTSGPAASDPERRRSGPAGFVFPPASRPENLEILVVEDDPATMRLLARLLRNLGHGVATAGTVAEAQGAIDAHPVDLIISDLGLPDGSGLDVVRHAVRTRGRVPAIALTGYGMEEDIRRSQDAGFLVHMTKPIDFTKLEAMIRRVTPPGGAI